VEPPHIRMTGFNRSASQPPTVLIFSFLDEAR